MGWGWGGHGGGMGWTWGRHGGHTIIIDENGTVNVEQAAIITVQAEAPAAGHWQIYMPSELHTTRTHKGLVYDLNIPADIV